MNFLNLSIFVGDYINFESFFVKLIIFIVTIVFFY